MNISFLGKIPVASCNVYDKQQNKYVNAIFSEYDCKDIEDIEEVGDLDMSWDFRDLYTSGMHEKFLKKDTQKPITDTNYYCMQNPNGDVIGVCKTKSTDDEIGVKLITSERDGKYKYVGYTMLAALAGLVLLGNKEKLAIKAALSDVCGYYKDVCGFRECYSPMKYLGINFEINAEEAQAFIKRVEEKTKGEMVNFIG